MLYLDILQAFGMQSFGNVIPTNSTFCHPRFSNSLSCFASLPWHCPSNSLTRWFDNVWICFMRATLLWMLWVPGRWNWRSLGSSMVAPGDLWVCESRHAKCHGPCSHAFNRLGSFPIGLWDDAFLVCGAESNLRPLQKIYDTHALHVHATIIHHILSASERRLHAAACSYVELLSWPLSSNSPSLSTHTRVHWNHVSNTHDGS